MLKKMMALWGKICPGCNIGRKYPNSFIGKIIQRHWEKGCPVNKAYMEIYGEKDPKKKV